MLRVILPILAISFSQVVQAKVIELDNKNPNHCRQQLITGLDPSPVVFIYMKNCFWAKKLRPIYEQVSDSFPNRNFFAFNFYDSDDIDSNAGIMRTAMECLGTTPFMSPVLAEYNVFATPYPDKYYGYINGIQKMGLDGAATKEDVIKFIGGSNQLQEKHTTLTK